MNDSNSFQISILLFGKIRHSPAELRTHYSRKMWKPKKLQNIREARRYAKRDAERNNYCFHL